MLVVRHCESSGPLPDASLTERGRTQAVELASFLEPYGPSRLVASPFVRTRESAQPLADRLELRIETDARLAEWGVPELVGPWFERMPRLLDAAEAPPDGVEPLEQAVARARAAIEDASRRGETSVLFTHGRILASCLARATGQRPSELWSSLSNPDVFAVAGDSVHRIWGAGPQTRTLA